MPEVIWIMLWQWIEITVNPNPLIQHSIKQSPNWKLPVLPYNIPASDLQPREGPHHGQIRQLGKPRGVHSSKEPLNVLWVFIQEVTLEDVSNDRCHRLWTHA